MSDRPDRPPARVDGAAPTATNRQLAVRLAVTRALGRARDLDGIYNAALNALAECFDVSRTAVLLFDADGVMRFKAYRGLSSRYRAAVEGHSPWTPDSLDAKPILVSDVAREPSLARYRAVIEAEGIAAMALIPLVSLGRVIGKFMVYYDAPYEFNAEDVQLARVIAAAVAFAVQRSGGDVLTSGNESGAISRDCLEILDLQGRVIYVSPEGVGLLGLQSPHDLLHRSFLDYWPEKDRPAIREAIALAQSGAIGRFQGAIATPSGVVRWWEVVITPIVDMSGAVTQLLAVSRDISAPWRDESFRAGQHQVLEMIATGAPLAEVMTLLVHLIEDQCDGCLASIVLLDPDGVHMRHGAAPSIRDSFNALVNGHPIGPAVGSCGTAMYFARQVIVSDIASDPLWDICREPALAHGLRACWSAPILSPQNRVLGSFAMYCRTARGPSREELWLGEIAADLAGIAIEHHRSQEALRQSEDRNRAILRALPDWMFILDTDGVFLDCHVNNPEDLLAPPDAFLGRSARDILPPSLADLHQRALERAFRTNEPETFDYSIDLPQGQRFYEACLVRCDTDRVLSIVRDITDRKRAELVAAAQRQELAHLNRVGVVGELSGTLAHELSQPLAAILTNAQAGKRLLAQGSPDLPEVQNALDDVIRNSKRAGAVIQGLRNLLKKGDSSPLPLNLNEVVQEVLDLMRSDLLVRRVSVRTSFAPDLPPVLGDRVQLQQVVLNLVLNACDAMIDVEPGGRQLTLATAVEDGLVHVQVSDSGLGIPGDCLDTVFEPFVTFRKQGLGLGLAISRSIVHSHRGRIVAENNADQGATFRCSLPVASLAVSAG